MSLEPSFPAFIGDVFFAALLEDSALQDWNLPVQRSIPELGLALHSNLGLKRGRNEDRLAAARVRAPNLETYTLAVVCDGVGGSLEGDQAATLAIITMISKLRVQRAQVSLGALAQDLLRTADSHVRSVLKGRGTTTASLFIASTGGQYVAANVGDSRVYSWRPGDFLSQVSIDDTVENELINIPGNHEAMINARGLKGRLSQAIGEEGRATEDLRIRVFDEKCFPFGVLIGSDGLWKGSKDFDVVASNSATANDAARRTIALANWNGGADNASIIVIEDLAAFCGNSSKAGRLQTLLDAKVWLGHSEFKALVRDARPAAQLAQEKSVRKEGRKKSGVKKESTPQLELPNDDGVIEKNKIAIEVSVGKKPL